MSVCWICFCLHWLSNTSNTWSNISVYRLLIHFLYLIGVISHIYTRLILVRVMCVLTDVKKMGIVNI